MCPRSAKRASLQLALWASCNQNVPATNSKKKNYAPAQLISNTLISVKFFYDMKFLKIFPRKTSLGNSDLYPHWTSDRCKPLPQQHNPLAPTIRHDFFPFLLSSWEFARAKTKCFTNGRFLFYLSLVMLYNSSFNPYTSRFFREIPSPTVCVPNMRTALLLYILILKSSFKLFSTKFSFKWSTIN